MAQSRDSFRQGKGCMRSRYISGNLREGTICRVMLSLRATHSARRAERFSSIGTYRWRKRNGSLCASIEAGGENPAVFFRQMRKVWSIVLILSLLLVGCRGPVPKEMVLYDFESEADLDRLHWRCHVLYSLSGKHATRGEKSLRMELYPSAYPGFIPRLEINDWREFEKLCFDVHNPQGKEIRIVVRIDDRKDDPDYADRYNKSFLLGPGMNRMKIPLKELMTSGTGRSLDLDEIHRFLVFMVKPQEKVVLYMDNIRLLRSG